MPLRPIPTPAHMELTGPRRPVRYWTLSAAPCADGTLALALDLFAARVPLPRRPAGPASEPGLVIEVALAAASPSPQDAIAAQSYELRVEPADNGPGMRAQIAAATPVAAAYALFTLEQLIEAGPDGASADLSAAHVVDRPDFAWRGISWGLWLECGVWSYDFGDGLAAFKRRALRALDLAFLNKLNLINVDGLGWNPERFPGYGALMRELAAAARLRGIRLLYTGYGAGYGAGPLHDGPVFRNRRAYPDGEIYSCGYAPGAHREAATYGTCLSNPDLLRLKQQNLREFVRSTHPGALYIHNQDSCAIEATGWENRCPECRRRWPNDDLCAPVGMAGAFAALYDALAEAVHSVRDDDAGYDAARDCDCIFISPGYGWYDLNDEKWDRLRKYWVAVSRAMQRLPGVQIGLREQFHRDDTKALRIEQLADDLRRDGRGHGIAVAAFAGADGFCNGLLYTGTPAFSRCYKGACTVLHAACGHAYQEPLALLCAEYAWRSEASAFYSVPAVSGRASTRRFIEFRDGLRTPRELFSDSGFLGAAARRLYGPHSGPFVAEVHAVVNSTGTAANPSAHRNLASEQCPPVAFVDNVELMNTPVHRAAGRWMPGQWAGDLPEAVAHRRSEMLRRIADANRWAAERMERAVTANSAGSPERDLLEWQRLGFLHCGELATWMSEYFALYADAQAAIRSDGTIPPHDLGGFLLRIDELDLQLTRLRDAVSLSPLGHARPLCNSGGAAGNWPSTLSALAEELRRLRAALPSGQRGEPQTGAWW